MKRKFIGLSILLIGAVILFARPAQAKVGVGINIGKIDVDQLLYSGGIYKLADLGVINTGTKSGIYEVGVSYLEGQKELKPQESWFQFKPAKFYLKPGQIRQVEIKLALPVNAKSGKYFAFIEGRPAPKKKGLAIGVAAAAKLTFGVKSSSLFWSIINRIKAIILSFAPYSYILLGLVLLILIWLIARRYVAVSFSLRKKKRDNQK